MEETTNAYSIRYLKIVYLKTSAVPLSPIRGKKSLFAPFAKGSSKSLWQQKRTRATVSKIKYDDWRTC